MASYSQFNDGKNGDDAIKAAVEAISAPAGTKTNFAWDNGYKTIDPVGDLASLIDVIQRYSKDKKYDVITIYGHSGGATEHAGVALNTNSGLGPGKNTRLELKSLQKHNGLTIQLRDAIKNALNVGGYVRILACGYKYKWPTDQAKIDTWTDECKAIAQLLNVKILFPEGQPNIWTGANLRFETMDTANPGWYHALP